MNFTSCVLNPPPKPMLALRRIEDNGPSRDASQDLSHLTPSPAANARFLAGMGTSVYGYKPNSGEHLRSPRASGTFRGSSTTRRQHPINGGGASRGALFVSDAPVPRRLASKIRFGFAPAGTCFTQPDRAQGRGACCATVVYFMPPSWAANRAARK